MCHSLFHVWGHIRNDNLYGGRVGIVLINRECFIPTLYVIKGLAINQRINRHRKFLYIEIQIGI